MLGWYASHFLFCLLQPTPLNCDVQRTPATTRPLPPLEPGSPREPPHLHISKEFVASLLGQLKRELIGEQGGDQEHKHKLELERPSAMAMAMALSAVAEEETEQHQHQHQQQIVGQAGEAEGGQEQQQQQARLGRAFERWLGVWQQSQGVMPAAVVRGGPPC